MKRRRQRGFTLPEVMTSLGVSMLVLAGAFMVFLQVKKGLLAATTDLQLLNESRLIRERMVRSLGASGNFGLREANISSLTITTVDANHNRISFLDGSSNSCFITETNFAGVPWTVVGGVGGYQQALMPNAPYRTFADKLLVTTGANNAVTINMRLGAINAGITSYYPQIINVRLINP